MAMEPELAALSMDLIAWVVERRGDVDWLDDDDRAEIGAALDSDAPGRERLERVVAVIDAKVTDRDVRHFLEARP